MSVGFNNSLHCEFTHFGFNGWHDADDNLFYAIVVAHVDFDPNMPVIQFEYTYDVETGGELVVGGETIEYSPHKRLLALNPFGEMELLLLNSAETDIVSGHDARKIWTQVVLKRLYRRTGNTTQGKRSGHWTYKDVKGRLAFEGDYVNGDRDGQWTYYYRSGDVRATISYANGKEHGDWTYFDPKGKISRMTKWKQGNPVDGPVQQVGLGFSEVRVPDKATSPVLP